MVFSLTEIEKTAQASTSGTIFAGAAYCTIGQPANQRAAAVIDIVGVKPAVHRGSSEIALSKLHATSISATPAIR